MVSMHGAKVSGNPKYIVLQRAAINAGMNVSILTEIFRF
jgi:hypothetical protein